MASQRRYRFRSLLQIKHDTHTHLLTYLLTYLITYLLTPCSTFLLENLAGFQTVTKFPQFMETENSLPQTQVPAPVSILSQLDPVHNSTSHFLKIYLNIILPSIPGSSKWSLSFRFSHQNSVYASTSIYYTTGLFSRQRPQTIVNKNYVIEIITLTFIYTYRERWKTAWTTPPRDILDSFPVCIYKFSSNYLNNLIFIDNILGLLATESPCIINAIFWRCYLKYNFLFICRA